jgi:hypothetical protein
MTAMYELWDTESRNLIEAFDSEARALAAIRRALKLHGPESVATLALVLEDEEGNSRTIALGRELVQRADPRRVDSAVPRG